MGRSWGRNPSSLGSLYCTYVQSCTLYCASSWLASTATNHLRKLESQHLAGLDALNPLQQFLFSRKQVFSHSSSMPTSPQPSWESALCDILRSLLLPRMLPVLSNRASDVMGLEVWHQSHGMTQPLSSLNVWDLMPFLRKASPRVWLRGVVSRECPSLQTLVLSLAPGTTPTQQPGSLLQRQPRLVSLLRALSFGQTGLSLHASGLGPDSSFTSTSGRPGVFGLPCGGCLPPRVWAGPCCPDCFQGYTLLFQHQNPHRLPVFNHNIFQRSGLST